MLPDVEPGMSEELSIPDFRAFTDDLVTNKGYTRNPCRAHCPYPDEHAHLRTPGGNHYDDFITWADGRYLGYDLTQPARLIYPGAPGSFRRR